MAGGAFQRARRPEQKRQRRAAILAAAAELLASDGVDGVTLNRISHRVGLAKSNLYRYFDSREQILAGVWGHGYHGTSRTVDNFISQLRVKLEPEPRSPRMILTVHGRGYRFKEP